MKGRFLARRRRNRGKRWAALLITVGLLGVVVAPFVWVQSDALAPGVTIYGEKVGGMTKGQLMDRLSERNQELAQGKVVLQRGDAEQTLSYKELNVHYDESSLDEAMALGRTGNIFTQWVDRWHLLFSGEASKVEAVYNTAVLDEKIAAMEKHYSQPPQNAYPVFQKDGSISFSKGRPYLKINEEALKSSLDGLLKSGETGTLDIPVTEEKDPNMTAAEAKEINQVLGRYTTYFYPEKNRSKNIGLAAKSIDGAYVKPGNHFSYNQTTGSRSAANGYLEAPVIINGKLEPGSGGGVCQVSTTLFNAVLLSGLCVTERTCHFSPVSYAPIGRDATVAEGSLDFCFQNHLKHGVYIYTEYAPGQVTIWILGNKEDKPSSVNITQTQDDTLPFKTITRVDPSQKEDCKEESGHEGHNVTIAQDVKWADGRVYHDTFFSDYEPVDTVITYNKATSGGQTKENS